MAVAGGWNAAGRCLTVGGGAGRSGASEQVLAAAVRRRRLDRLLAQLRHQRDIPCQNAHLTVTNDFLIITIFERICLFLFMKVS